MRTINTDLIEKILHINVKLLNFANKNIFNGTGITANQFNILGEIILCKGIKINELIEKLIISAPALSQTINRMEKAGLITRNFGEKDKREIILKHTEKAYKIYYEINLKYIGITEDKLGKLNLEDKKTTLKLLEEIEKIIN